MAIELIVGEIKLRINDDVIDRDIAQLEKEGRIIKVINGVSRAPRPNLHGLLTCLRDLRNYSATEIGSVCFNVCPMNPQVNPLPDDSWHLDDCWKYLFEGISLDGKTHYVEFLK